MQPEFVILVNEQDERLGCMEKLQAHKEGKLHRAISVFIFNSNKQLLLQKRASGKYHSANLWTNTCCSHPRENEDTQHAAERRLQEEMGISCNLKHQFNFIYKAALENNLTEHEFDHVFFGFCDDIPKPNAGEVSEWKYESMVEIKNQLEKKPAQFTAWFKLIFERVTNLIEQ